MIKVKSYKLKLKVGDTVKVMAGKDKGRDGKIEKVLPSKSKIVVTGVNLYKKHLKGIQGQKGGIYDIPRPIDVSKVMIVCPNCKKTAKIGLKIEGKDKIRVCKKCNKNI